MGSAPVVDCFESLAGVALAMSRWRKYPAGFGSVAEGRGEVAVIVGETGFAEKCAGGLVEDSPVAEAEQRPVAGVAQQASPGFFGGLRLAADEAGDGGVAPHGRKFWEIFAAMGAQGEPRSFEDGSWHGGFSWAEG